MTIPAFAALAVLLPLLGSGLRAAGLDSPRAETSDSDRLFHEGVRRYAEGDAESALALFREVARREPGHRAALAAIRRLEAEAARTQAKPPPPTNRAPSIRRFILETLPRWFKGGAGGEDSR